MVSSDFFTSFEEGDPQPGTGQRLRVHVGAGPTRPLAARAGRGCTGAGALYYTTTVEGPARAGLFTVDIPVSEDTELSYVVLPESDAEPTYFSTFVAVDLEFADGATLSGLSPAATAKANGESKKLYLDQWNPVRLPVGEFAQGRTITAIVLTTANPAEGHEISGWIDDLRVGARKPVPTDPVDLVRTTRGTHSGKDFSRGNCFPATAVPNGFNFWTPVTDAGALDWPYHYQDHALQAFSLSHLPSPWVGDRHTFQVMPGTGEVVTDRVARALSFSHERETDLPFHYGVRFDGGISTDIAPADHGAIFRFGFPGEGGWLLFDNARNRGGLRIDTAARTVTGHTWVRSRSASGARRMFVYATFDERPVEGRRLTSARRRAVTGYLRFSSSVVTMRIATSLLSVDQAKRNLDDEVAAPLTFEQVRDAARQRWRDLLGRVEVSGATTDELVTLYSCLYRLFLYPNSAHENTPEGTRHASPVLCRRWPSTRRRTGAAVRPGTMSVNNGFWDTYRTAWPAYALLAPELAGALLDGFVRQYQEGGWISRWSCPGYADAMVGTGSDVVFADAYLKGVRGFDVEAAYAAAVKNATVSPARADVGRKGLGESIFLGYTPTSTREGLSWALENCVNDFGLANWAHALGNTDDAAYFRSRAAQYVHHFDRSTGFFQGRTVLGGPRWDSRSYDPAVWGYDYAETNGWNTAFSAPHDVAGLSALHGGNSALESVVDTFFGTPETGRRTGSYRKVIHEMTEAAAVRLGQYGHSNQPSHHIPYVYALIGAPAKTQRIVREVLGRCYLGSDLGQGYPGDEDNGEMSAWYVLSALGLYPLAVGSPWYVIGSPLFRHAVVHLGGGADLVVNAPDNTDDNVFVQGLRVDGIPHEQPWIAHSVIAAGAVLDFDMGPEPSSWGTTAAVEPVEPSPLRDLAGTASSSDGTDVRKLFDDTTATEVAFRSATPTVEHTANYEAGTVKLYTLTSASRDDDPKAWVLEGSDDGLSWTVLDSRAGESFAWRRQTRAFAVPEPRPFRRHRLRITDSRRQRLRLAQWELLA
ncbi:GH92 family glycosyl hydrolase [Saccharomonospora sp. NPDC006951]